MTQSGVTMTPLLALPPLENGDRLTRAEFERRYHAMPHLRKAELLEGIVYMPSPVRATSHGAPHAAVIGWLVMYQAATPGVQALDNATVRLDADNEPQPDALLRLVEGGQSRLSADDYVEGAPELIIEIAASSASYDLHEKRRVYRRNGVQEYLVWRVYEQAFDWFHLAEGAYRALVPNAEGILSSQMFPGLWLDPAALLTGTMARVLNVLQQGIATEAHQAFVRQLQNRAL